MKAQDCTANKMVDYRWPAYTFMGIALLVIFSNAHAFQKEPAEFRGIKWGEPFSVHGGEMTLLGEDERGKKWYVRKNDKMSFGEAELRQLVYVYADGQFLRVNMETSGARNRDALMNAFVSEFGHPDENNSESGNMGLFKIDYSWGDYFFEDIKNRKRTDVQVSLLCRGGFNSTAVGGAEDDCEAQIVSNRVLHEVGAARVKRQEETAALAHGATCPTATTVQAKAKGRYITVYEANDFPRPYGWVFNNGKGWAIFRDTKYDNDYFADRAGFLAVRKSTIRKPLVKGSRLSALAPYYGVVGKPTWTEDQYGRPILVDSWEAIYPEGCN